MQLEKVEDYKDMKLIKVKSVRFHIFSLKVVVNQSLIIFISADINGSVLLFRIKNQITVKTLVILIFKQEHKL